MIRSYACLVSSALVRLSRPCNLGDAKASVLAGDARKIREMVQDLILPSRRDRDPELFVKIFGSGVRTLVFVAGLGGTTRYWETRVAALGGKIIGAGIPALLSGLTRKEALGVGFGMSGRGAVELIIVSIALEAGLFDYPDPVVANLFSALVLMALVTTIVTPIGLRWLFRDRG